MGVGGRNISKLNTAAPEVCLFHCGLCVVPTGADKSRQTITIPGVILLAGGARLASLRTSPQRLGKRTRCMYTWRRTSWRCWIGSAPKPFAPMVFGDLCANLFKTFLTLISGFMPCNSTCPWIPNRCDDTAPKRCGKRARPKLSRRPWCTPTSLIRSTATRCRECGWGRFIRFCRSRVS